MPLVAGMGGGRSREGGVATARGPLGPEGGRNREREIVLGRSWAGTDTDPEARTGPRARALHLTLGPDAGREARLLCLAPAEGPEAGPDLHWPRWDLAEGCGLASPGKALLPAP